MEHKKEAVWRPEVHFSPNYGWLNDPNGLIKLDDEYHMFFQYYPEGTSWGPMHWGHAVSEDLIHWKELPIALYPDDMGYIFSGSCILDKENISGFGKDGEAPVLAFYTSNEATTHQEQQCVAYSHDRVNFTKYDGNPIIPGPEHSNRRDPEVIRNDIIGGFTMILTEEERIAFYHSEDLIHWEMSGSFAPGESGLSGICECPCLFRTETSEGEKWVLMISMILTEEERKKTLSVYNKSGYVMQYYVGDFDGKTFHDTEKADVPLLVDYGTDFYAGVVFSNVDYPLSVGWLGNWEYSADLPTSEEEFRGVMSLPRKLSLVKTEEGLRLKTEILTENIGFKKSRKVSDETADINAGALVLRASAGGEGEIIIGNGTHDISVKITETDYIIDRSNSGRMDFNEKYAEERLGIFRIPRQSKSGNLKLIWDHSVLEIEADNGLTPATLFAFPEKNYDRVSVKGNVTAEIFE
ncbi:fructan beta-fructosidase [Lachnospiraceae bacterium]|nr:fructan beta-fructosidase [Lachnospiraceae bacterium]